MYKETSTVPRRLLTLLLLLASIGVSVSPVRALAAAASAATEGGGFFTTSDGVKLHYLDAGQGRPIVFIPGGIFSGEYWEPQIREFSRDHRTIALSHRGRGRSEDGLQGEGYEFPRLAEDIHQLIEHLGLSNVVLVGSSMGVKMVLTYVDRFGTGRLGSLVMVDAAIWQPAPRQLERCIEWVDGIRAMESDRRAWSEQMVRGMFTQPHPKGYLEGLIDLYLRVPTNIAAWYGVVSFCSPVGADKRSALPKLAKASTPVMYAFSTPAYRAQADTVKGLVPGARIEAFDGVGHAIAADAPERFNRVLRDFLKKASSPK